MSPPRGDPRYRGRNVGTATLIPPDLVTEAFDYDGGRRVSVYVPADSPTALVYAADGEVVAGWGALLGASPPIMVVGVHRAADETQRLHEYSPGFDPSRFAAHESFVVDDVRRWIASRFGVALQAGRTAVYGASAGGELALALGLRHPELFGTVLCASPGAGYRPPAELPRPLPRVHLAAGTSEPFFLANATRWENALRNVGADVVMTESAGSHGDAFWRDGFPALVDWAFRSR